MLCGDSFFRSTMEYYTAILGTFILPNTNELMKKANVSRSTFYKLKNGDNVNTETLLRICNALQCDISEIVECVEESV